MRRLEAFLYSRRNIVGSALALVGVGLNVVGLLGGGLFWVPITAGLYAIGYLLVPGERDLAIRLGEAQDEAEVREGLNRLLRGLRGKVADDLYRKVESIRDSIVRTLDVEGAESTADPNVYLIRQTALAYLPDAFATYLKMPRVVAERRTIAAGRTPHDVLLDQLELMDGRLAEVADDIARHDSDKLLANGRFLAEKFATSGLELEAAAEATASVREAGVRETARQGDPQAEREAEAARDRERVR